MTLKEAWNEVLSYGSSNRCSAELAIQSLIEDKVVPKKLKDLLYLELSRARKLNE